MELMGKEQSMFTDNIAKMGLSAGMRSDSEYTLLAPINFAFTGETSPDHSHLSVFNQWLSLSPYCPTPCHIQ